MPGPVFLMLLQVAAQTPPATDYVVHGEIVPDHGASSGDRRIVYRSGNLMRTEWTLYRDRSGTTYVDFARRLSLEVLRDREGTPTRVTIQSSARLSADARRRATGRRDRALGEDCAVWRVFEENSASGREICETVDGIMLWNAFWYPPGNRTVFYERATAIERRAVRPEEVLPSATLFALALEPPPPRGTDGASSDFEVEMVGARRTDGSYVQRRHAGFSSRESRELGLHSIETDNGAIRVSYSETEAGLPVSMQIIRSASGPRRGRVFQWENVPGRAPERLLGETCIWQENVAIRGTDQFYECRTADGIPLKTEANFEWTGLRRFTARRLSRRPLADADFAPPARALDWATWGITPAP